MSSSSCCCCCWLFFSGVDRGVRFGEAFTDHSEEDNEEVARTGLGWLGGGGGGSGLELHVSSVGVSGGGMGRIEADVCRRGGGFAEPDQEEDGVCLPPTGDMRLGGDAENVCGAPEPRVRIRKRVEGLCGIASCGSNTNTIHYTLLHSMRDEIKAATFHNHCYYCIHYRPLSTYEGTTQRSKLMAVGLQS